MNIVVTKIVVVVIILAMTSIGTYLGLCCLKLRKKNEQLRKDRNELIKEVVELRENLFELSDTERKLIYIAINLPAFKKEIRNQGLNATYQPLKQKIWDSIHV